MNVAAVDPLLYVACAGLLCLFLVSTVILVVVMARRSRRTGNDGTGSDGSGNDGT